MGLGTEVERHRIVRGLLDLAERENLTGQQKNDLARRLAAILGFDFGEFTAKRMLQLMNAREVAEVAGNGVDVQLHTHRHRTPDDEVSFRREIADNKNRIRALTGHEATHFCYPGGIYRKEFAAWLQKENVVSATTCDAGLVTRQDNPYLLQRVVDTTGRSGLEFESWVCGLGHLLAVRRTAPQRYILPRD
jgi:peptidoglycan/xylan/chitin deacetylase (PgdA/CDA1 family)